MDLRHLIFAMFYVVANIKTELRKMWKIVSVKI